jgi:hypothetical protein
MAVLPKTSWMGLQKADPNALAQQLRSLDDEALLSAFHHPDQPEGVRQFCLQELQGRGLASETIEGWMPAASALTLPPTLPPGTTKAQYLTTARIRMFLVDLSFVCATVCLLYLIVPGLNASFARWFGFSPFIVFRLPYTAELVFALSLLVLLVKTDRNLRLAAKALAAFSGVLLLLRFTYGGFRPGGMNLVVLVLTLVTCTALAAVAGFVVRHGMIRVLLLRPFGQARMTRALKKVVKQYLAPIGYVYTLSDRNYRPSVTMALMALIGQFRHLIAPILRPSLRLATVSNDTSFKDLVVSLRPGFEIGAKSAYSGGQAFNIRSTDHWWQRCIDLLLHSTEITVMDVSRVSAGSTWEIIRLARRNLLDNCIFIVQEQYQQEGAQLVKELLPGRPLPPIHVFRGNGTFLDAAAFQAAIDQKLEQALARLTPVAAS